MTHRRAPSLTARSAGLAGLVLAAASCTTGGGAGPSSSASADSTSPGQSAAPGASSPQTAQTPGPAFDLIVLHGGTGAGSDGYAVVEISSGQTVFSLPWGAISADWHTLVGVSVSGASTNVQVDEAEGGSLRREIDVPGAWRLPTIGVAHAPSGLSADGGTLVLEEAITASTTTPHRTRFAVVATDGSTKPRLISLDGTFNYDALSPDGAWLYLIEHLAGGDPTNYNVRRLDLATGLLQDGAIVDKRNVNEQMGGYAVTQVAGRGGWVYTLYRGHDGAFIHALSTADGGAFCIDLPGTSGATEATAGDWGLALSPAGDELYVANASLHFAGDVELTNFSVKRTSTLATAAVMELAKFEAAQPAGGRLGVSQDGATLYVLGKHGVTVVSAVNLTTTGQLGGDRAYRSVAGGSNGAVYAVGDDGKAVVLGPGATPSAVLGGTGYTGIVAVIPLR